MLRTAGMIVVGVGIAESSALLAMDISAVSYVKESDQSSS